MYWNLTVGGLNKRAMGCPGLDVPFGSVVDEQYNWPLNYSYQIETSILVWCSLVLFVVNQTLLVMIAQWFYLLQYLHCQVLINTDMMVNWIGYWIEICVAICSREI